MGSPETPEIRSLTVQYEVFESEALLKEDERELLTRARGAMQSAHSPYSDFMVGAAVQLADGTIFIGSNQENAAYGSTICAERSALMTVGSQKRHKDIRKIAVMGTGRSFDTTAPVTPCGACRQVIKEFEDLGGEPITLIMSGATGEIYRMNGIDSLLPFGFGPKDLNLS